MPVYETMSIYPNVKDLYNFIFNVKGWTFDDERISGSQFDKMSAFNGSMHGSMHGSIHGSQFHGRNLRYYIVI